MKSRSIWESIFLSETVVCLCLELDWFVACGLVLTGVGGQTEVDVSVKDLPPGTFIYMLSFYHLYQSHRETLFVGLSRKKDRIAAYDKWQKSRIKIL